MKVVLFCGGLGTRIREYSDAVPKPMIPIGNQPILWHVMQYYSHFGHRDFILCTGYKSTIIKKFFLEYKSHVYADCIVSRNGTHVEQLGAPDEEWRVAMIDTGIWRNIGERLWAVRDHVMGEELFLANYSDGLCDVDLNEMIAQFKASRKIVGFIAVRPPLSFHLADIDEAGEVNGLRSSADANIWINGGYFIMRPAIFDYMRDGDELVIEPFQRLIDDGQLFAYKYTGFWRAMDTLRDRQMLEEMVEQGNTPWHSAFSRKTKQTM